MEFLKQLALDRKISPPKWLPESVQYAVVMGSTAYGVANDRSDMDINGFCIPPKSIVFPHTAGVLVGYDHSYEKFENWSEHHIFLEDSKTPNREHDLTIHSIVEFFKLTENNNPEKLDTLFVPDDCILHMTPIGEHVRKHRHLFLNKKAWHTYKGYAHSQLRVMDPTKEEIEKRKIGEKRQDMFAEYGFDVKKAYHVVRLMLEIEQILIEQDLDLRRHSEVLKEIRAGKWTKEEVVQFFKQKEADLETAYVHSELPNIPQHDKLKPILLECLEMSYGSLDHVVMQNEKAVLALKRIQEIAANTLDSRREI